MVDMTPEQEKALKRVYERDTSVAPDLQAFKEKAQVAFGCDGAITIQWKGMWLCVETDGYTHS